MIRRSFRVRASLAAIASLSGALAALLIAAGAAAAHDPIPTHARNFHGNNPVTFHFVSSPGPWYSSEVIAVAETNFRALNSNNSRVPTLSNATGGTGTVIYSSAANSPCNTNPNPAWLQCTSNINQNEYWTIYIRNLSSGGPSGWDWYEKTGSCPSGTSSCWYLKRAMIHELGHAMLGFPDMCLGSQPCRSEDDTVMNETDPHVGLNGSTPFIYRKCDEAGSQLQWNVISYSNEYGDCFDHIEHAGATGLTANVDVTGSTFFQCNGQSVPVSGRLEVWDFDSYGPLGGNPLEGRVVWFNRGATTNYTSATATGVSPTDNWTKSFGGSNVTYTFTAHFDSAPGDGLADSDRPTFTITWSNQC